MWIIDVWNRELLTWEHVGDLDGEPHSFVGKLSEQNSHTQYRFQHIEARRAKTVMYTVYEKGNWFNAEIASCHHEGSTDEVGN